MCLYEYNEELHLKEERDIAMEKGEQRISTLYRLLVENDRMQDILKATKNPEYQKKLLDEFGL